MGLRPAQAGSSWGGGPSRPRWSNCKGARACSMVASMPWVDGCRVCTAAESHSVTAGPTGGAAAGPWEEDCGAWAEVYKRNFRVTMDGVERCSCPLLPPGPWGPAPRSGTCRGPLDGFRCSGSSGSALQALQGELSEVILTFSLSMTRCMSCRPPWRARVLIWLTWEPPRDRIISEINRTATGGHRARRE